MKKIIIRTLLLTVFLGPLGFIIAMIANGFTALKEAKRLFEESE